MSREETNKNMDYISKGKTSSIGVHSRCSVKIFDSYYTFEYSEDRIFSDSDEIDLDKERELLWQEAHKQVDLQINDAIDSEQEIREKA